MNVVAERFIELSILKKHRRLTLSETREFNESLKHLEKLEWQKAKLKNLSLAASMIDDVDWQHEICEKLEKLH
ncbi:hypothetical protein GCM10011409_18630 [Lentibacillus populi]|uniref:Uncharacterized protein n=1 Tax=Lentibacillus populi TaxID=1827502 RepID=A0A9W5TXP3_9BACI|nr:hypothetical protein [Lentibacillus populi]GGB41384.1 hypothetical protein GCM10011409_18630 [Lentibacillus populi]